MSAINEAATLKTELLDHARELGMTRVGIARVEDLGEDWTRYRAFLDAGMHGEMHWLARNAESRRSVDPAVVEKARTVIVCALSYHREHGSTGLQDARIARYARGRDYHNFFRKSLRKLAVWLRAKAPGNMTRATVDTSPVLERAWAARSGVGFVGKNGCVIVPGVGSYVLLGEVVTTVELEPDVPVAPRCGQCTLCLDQCPTQAFKAPYVLDARRCVSYLTIEHEGVVPESLRAGVGPWFFGCDVCQEVCPYNRVAPDSGEKTASFAGDPRREAVSAEYFLTATDADVTTLVQGTPLARSGPEYLARNAAIVLGNTGTKRHLPVLSNVATEHPSGVVRASAQWAVEQIRRRG